MGICIVAGSVLCYFLCGVFLAGNGDTSGLHTGTVRRCVCVCVCVCVRACVCVSTMHGHSGLRTPLSVVP